ncbi:MAG: hypothetical protein DLM72_07840 [Candidatus Nitrosopolaris wilkensis]|nr:MAG: hypothetical protein DLM72_07840 [Candidatus Nitrosopolaris wilkensis]
MKTPLLRSIVWSNIEGGYYDKAATIYSDIVFKFADTVKMAGPPISREFKDYELANWLLHNCNAFKDKNYYHGDRKTTNNANRLKGVIRNIQGKVNDLIRLVLMDRVGETKQSKGTGMVSLYQFGPFTYLFLSVVRSSNPEPQKRAAWVDHAYNIYQLLLTSESAPTINVLYAGLYRKFKEHGVFKDFVIDYLTEALISNKEIRHVKDLFYDLQSGTDDLEKLKLYHSLRNESLKELDPDARQRVFLFLKPDIERKIGTQVHSLKDYEEALLRSKESPETLAVEGYCKECNTHVEALADIMEYLDAVALSLDEPIKKPCPTCHNDSLLVPKILF